MAFSSALTSLLLRLPKESPDAADFILRYVDTEIIHYPSKEALQFSGYGDEQSPGPVSCWPACYRTGVFRRV